jgi:hypothetical protein
MPGDHPTDAHPSPEVLTRLAAAEDRLYPLAMIDVERFQRAITLCGLLLDELRSRAADAATLLELNATLPAGLPAIAADAGVSLHGLRAETLVDAATATRWRELEASAREGRREARLEAARQAGQTWLVDEPDPASVTAGFFRRVETHVPSGVQLVMSSEAGTGAAPAAYRLELFSRPGEPPTRVERFADEESWRSAADRCRSQIQRRP